ncbi:MAG TPA: CCA tRNA nucleotidyltransferase [Thermoplasmata archaeon]|nr:CCA tRNA nucleotidyltransferase [Thermoplasmata archaeon]
MTGAGRSEGSSTEAIEAEVAGRLRPTPEFLSRLARTRTELLERAHRAAADRSAPLVRAVIAGSAARGGFLSDRVDIDLFLLFDPKLSRDALRQHGLDLARTILPEHEIRYAEHPYLRGTFEGFRVDAVPGYAVADGAHPQSAVDRTPFHQAYLEARETPELLDQIRLTKQFLRVLGVYGSEARTGGFSGYLVELLVLRFGSFRCLLEAARSWRPPVRLPTTPGAAPRVPDDTALILDDPVDPARNVSSALTRQNLALFVLAAAAYLEHPHREAFTIAPTATWDRAHGLAAVAERGTHVAVLTVPRMDLVDDVLYPQLRRAERGVRDAADRWGFQPIGTGVGADAADLVLAVEVAHGRLPAVRVRDGPPVGLDRVGSFLEKWQTAQPPPLQGPYVRTDGTLAVETLREHRGLETLLAAELPQLALGQDLRRHLGEARVRSLAEAPEGPALHDALRELFGKSLPVYLRPDAGRSTG